MSKLPKFEQKIQDMVSSAVERSNPVLRAVIVRSYYGTRDAAVESQTAEILLDVAVIGGNGGALEQIEAVPLARTWGMQPSLPPAGAEALLLTNGDRKNGTYAVAVFETDVTNGQLDDNEAPQTLPKVLLS